MNPQMATSVRNSVENQSSFFRLLPALEVKYRIIAIISAVLCSQVAIFPNSECFSQEASVNKPRSPIRGLASFAAPKGWTTQETDILAEPIVTLSSGTRKFSLELFGGKDSRHETPQAFLESFEARGDDGKPPASLGSVLAAGRKIAAYARRYTMSGQGRAPDDMPARPEVMDQQFVVLVVGKKFLVVSWTRTSLPDMAGSPATEKLEPEFGRFLKGLRIKKR